MRGHRSHMITASKEQAVRQIEIWAGEAEDGNYHGLASALSALADQVADYGGRGDLGFFVWTVKSVDEFPASANVECIHVAP